MKEIKLGHRSYNPVNGRNRQTKYTAGAVALILFFTAGSGKMSPLKSQEAYVPPENSVIRPYDITDPRFCYLTPDQFTCEKCLNAGDEFIQILTFDADGRPTRMYACRRS